MAGLYYKQSTHEFSVSYCSAPSTAQQRTPASPSAAGSLLPAPHTLNDHRQVSQAWDGTPPPLQKGLTRHGQFVTTGQFTARLTCCSRRDQYFAIRMLIGETCRFFRQIREEENSRAPRDKSGIEAALHLNPRQSTRRCPEASDKHSPNYKHHNGNRFSPLTKRRLRPLFDERVASLLAGDVSALMGSDVWGPNPPHTTEKHPFLFTMNQVHKMGLFSSCRDYM